MNKDLREQITRLNQIGIALSAETNLDRLLDLIVHEVRGFTQADAGSLYIRVDDHLQFVVAQNDTLQRRSPGYQDSFKPFPLPLTKSSIAGFVALTGQILNIEDVYHMADSSELGFNRDFDERNDYRTRSMLVVPMTNTKGENIGVLQLINALGDGRQVVSFEKEVENLVLSLASQAAVAIRNAQLIASIKNLFAALVQYSASAIDARSPHTAGHSRRVASLALLLAQRINRRQEGPWEHVRFSPEELEELSYAAWLHDIGKIGVREHVLEKANKLSDTRMQLIRCRFDQIALNIRLSYERRFRELQPDDRVDANRLWEDWATERDQLLEQLQQHLELIEKTNIPGWLRDEDLSGLKAIKDQTFTDGNGNTLHYLDDFEFENLSIRKGNLTLKEYQEIQSHVVHTFNIVKKIPFTPELSRIPTFAAAHHEMLNGTGYPNGLKGDTIPLQARILGVVDIFDALVASDRPYKRAMPVDKALSILQEEAKTGRLDAELVDLFIREKVWQDEQVDSLHVRPEDHLNGL